MFIIFDVIGQRLNIDEALEVFRNEFTFFLFGFEFRENSITRSKHRFTRKLFVESRLEKSTLIKQFYIHKKKYGFDK